MAATKKIAILTLSFGSGHVRAAEVIHRALYDGGEPVIAQTFDALEYARRWFLWLYVEPYWWMLRHAPWLWRRLFEHRQSKHHRATAPHWMFRHGCQELLKRLKAFGPDLIIATEIGAAEIAALGKREGWFHAPLLAVQTDFHTEPPWVQKEIDMYCVGSEEARAQLLKWGVSPNRVLCSGIPVDPAFALAFDRPDLLRAFGLDASRPIVLAMGGGMGPVPLDEIARYLERSGHSLQVLTVAGHDATLKRRLELLRGKVALDLHVFGWTDTVPELMAVSDLLVTKPGGVTSSEALAMGVPMVLTHPIPGPEERHVRYLEQTGAAVRVDDPRQLPHLVSRLLSSPARLQEMRRKARELARPDAVHVIAQVSRALLEKATYMELLASPPAHAGESAYLM